MPNVKQTYVYSAYVGEWTHRQCSLVKTSWSHILLTKHKDVLAHYTHLTHLQNSLMKHTSHCVNASRVFFCSKIPYSNIHTAFLGGSLKSYEPVGWFYYSFWVRKQRLQRDSRMHIWLYRDFAVNVGCFALFLPFWLLYLLVHQLLNGDGCVMWSLVPLTVMMYVPEAPTSPCWQRWPF